MKGSFYQEGKSSFHSDQTAATNDHAILTTDPRAHHLPHDGEAQEHLERMLLEQKARTIFLRRVQEIQRRLVTPLTAGSLSLADLQKREKAMARTHEQVEKFKSAGHDLLLALLPEIREEKISLAEFEARLNQLETESVPN